ncbi:MAG: Eco57I restriction-modification methylase domain-containing protein [Synergistes sp.]|nr:Eco57I restriction-modification methylase domain-containing protein [Synergistes sp.]
MQDSDAFVLKKDFSEDLFSNERFSALMEELFPNASTSDRWIRSGMHIPAALKDTISSYRLISRHKASEGHGHADCILVKLAPGADLRRSEKKCRAFILSYMKKEACDAVLLAIAPAGGSGFISMLLVSQARRGVVIPPEIIDMTVTQGIKNYLMKSCGLSPAALDGYFSQDTILFDDTPIAQAARDIDAALDGILFCDIACGCGDIAAAAAKITASARMSLNRYLSQSQNRTEDAFLCRFLENSFYATDCSAAALDILKARLRILCPGVKLPEERFVWGSVLVDKIFENLEFDLIISNPPHLRGGQLSSLKPLLFGYSSSRFNSDVYCYYVEKSYSMLSERGSSAMLVSDKWMKTKYGEGLRDFFSFHKPYMIMELGKPRELKGSTAALSAIFFFRTPQHDAARFADSSLDLQAPTLSLFEGEFASVKENTAAQITAGGTEAQKLVHKLTAENRPFSQSGLGKVYRGILTGLNEAFVLPEETALALSKDEPASEELIVPFYSGRDIKRYYIPAEKKYLIFMPKGYTDGMSGFSDGYMWFAKNHPRLASHLARFEAKASARRDRGDYWWELRPCSYYSVFRGKKIVLPIICRNISAAFDSRGVYVNDKCCMIDSSSFFLAALLKSRLLDFVFRAISPELLNNYYELRPSVIAKLPIASPKSAKAKETANKIAEMGEKLSELYAENPPAKYGSPPAEIREAERETNRLVYSLYGLTPKEIAVVENN